jgi:hypothetical protein
VTGFTKHDVPNVQAGLELVQWAKKQRHTSSNHLNAHSSQLHSICQLERQISTMSTTVTDDPIDNDTPTNTKTFWIVDWPEVNVVNVLEWCSLNDSARPH